VAGVDDYSSIKEVVSRRYRDAGQNGELYPDVILIDGGLGQLHAAQEAFGGMDVKPPMVISLAKREEEIFVQARQGPVKLSRTNAGLKLLQHIRDEAHRFGQSYHHLLISKKRFDEEVVSGKRPPKGRSKKQGARSKKVKEGGEMRVLSVEEVKRLTKEGVDRPQDRGPQPPEPGDGVSQTLT
jgi:excinuclease ABC subunit C